jgi:hypothetical protein
MTRARQIFIRLESSLDGLGSGVGVHPVTSKLLLVGLRTKNIWTATV